MNFLSGCIFLLPPVRIGIMYQIGVVISSIASNFPADPWRFFKLLSDKIEFDLGHEKTGVFSFELIDFPSETGKKDAVPDLFYQWSMAQPF